MVIFFADRPLTISSRKNVGESDSVHFDHILDVRLLNRKKTDLSGHVLFLNVTAKFAVEIVRMLRQNPPADLLSVKLLVNDKKAVVDSIKRDFKVIKAAGGIVYDKDRCLLIYRKKKWDLPKGKLDKDESSRKAAVRETKEETGVAVRLQHKICTTWHTYAFNDELVLKRTKWFLLECISDRKMKPQAEEEIERLEWVPVGQAKSYLVNSYSSIRYVFERFEEKLIGLSK
ncbi:MAG: NUDIX hydrolase [Cytophagaceae bacterium SCN 52-12]|nr:MAG: NUDIX hydrolase [Cytophagaceae bacterium SCN 52-12]